MKTLKYFFILTLFSLSILSAQPNLTLTIENQNTVGTEFFFDLYLTAPDDLIYLGNSDFVLTFDAGNFTTPTLLKVASTCTLVPTDISGINTLFLQLSYFNATAVSILNTNELVINLSGPTPSDVAAFNSTVARIDGTPSTHRLGTFKVTGITNPGGVMNLQWKASSTIAATQNPTTFAESPCVLTLTSPLSTPLPVELSSFSVNAVEGTKAQLQWETATEVNNYGFEIERSLVKSENPKVKGENAEASEAERKWEMVAFVEGHGNSNSIKSYTFTDKDLVGGSKFMYRLKQIDIDGKFEYSDAVEIEVLPTKYELLQNYPNPFNPETNIRFSLPENAKIAINIYNILGEKVTTLLNKELDAGFHQVNFNTNSAGYKLASGMYIYTIETKNFSQVKKMILLK